MTLGQRQASESRQRFKNRCPTSLEHNRIAELELQAAQPNRGLPPTPADCQDVEAISLAQMQIRGRTTDQLRIGSDDSLDRREPVRVQFSRHESGNPNFQ